MTDVTQLTLEEAQKKILAGENLTTEEYKHVLNLYRTDRRAAAATSKKSRGKAQQLPADFDLNKELDDLLGIPGGA